MFDLGAAPHFNLTEVVARSPPGPSAVTQAQRALGGGAATELGTARPGISASTLTRDGANWRLDGRKFHATGPMFPDYASIGVAGDGGVSMMCMVPTKRAGIELLDDWGGRGQRMTARGSLVMNGVQVFDEEIVPREYGGLIGRHSSALCQLHRVAVAVAAGIVRNALADATGYVQTRGRPVAHGAADSARGDPFNQQVVGDMAAASHAIAGALATARTQIVVARLALQACHHLYDAGGASMTARTLNFDRHWRNVRTIFSRTALTHRARVVGDWHLNGTGTHLREGRVF